MRQKVRKEWMEFVQRISKADPSATAILDTEKGTLDTATGNILIDETLLPKIKFIQENTSMIKRPILEKDGKVLAFGFSESEYKK